MDNYNRPMGLDNLTLNLGNVVLNIFYATKVYEQQLMKFY